MVAFQMRMPHKSILSSWIKRGSPQDAEDQKQSIQLDNSEAKSKAVGGLAPTTMVRTRRAAMEAMRRRSAEKSWEEAEEKVKRQLQAMERARELEFEKLKERLQKEKQVSNEETLTAEEQKMSQRDESLQASQHKEEKHSSNPGMLLRHTISGRPMIFKANDEIRNGSVQDMTKKAAS